MKRLIEKIGFAALHKLDPETGHGLAMKALKMGLLPQKEPFSRPRLQTDLAGLTLPNPVGLAAGFDKNAEVIAPLLKSGFGFIEVGAVTPKPQSGNPKPRLFRLREDQAAINRFGFNNDGMDAIANRLSQCSSGGVVGVNLGANKNSVHRAVDYVRVLEACGPYVDFATINVSSPNTEKLRNMQQRDVLHDLIRGVLETRDKLAKRIPVFLKVAPDLTPVDIEDIAQVARLMRIDAIIATNTTIDRDGLTSPHADEAGGLSGQPLFEKSTKVLAQFFKALQHEVPLIGVGGIASAKQAYIKIKAGASAVQLYTGLIYCGFSLAETIARDLDELLKQDGFNHISEAVGCEKGIYI